MSDLTSETKLYRFYWRFNDKPVQGRGINPADAFTRLGFGAGAVRVLDYYVELKEPECPTCRTVLAFEGDVCGLCNPETTEGKSGSEHVQSD